MLGPSWSPAEHQSPKSFDTDRMLGRRPAGLCAWVAHLGFDLHRRRHHLGGVVPVDALDLARSASTGQGHAPVGFSINVPLVLFAGDGRDQLIRSGSDRGRRNATQFPVAAGA